MSNYSLPNFRLDRKDWLGGNNSYDDFPEGGAKAETVGVNSFSKPGLLSQSPVLGSAVTGSLPTTGVISWGIGSGATSPAVISVFGNASNNGSFYSVDESTGGMTKVGADDTTRSYKLGITDTVWYNGNFYTTSETDICKNSADLATRVESWWVGTESQTALTVGIPHPLLVYESIMYIADGKFLHKLDGTTISTEVWDAPPDHIITAMIEYNGLMYIVAEPYKNLTGSVHGLSQMFSWDGLLESWYEQYFLDYRINSLYVYKNALYGWTNDYCALWTGTVFEPLRPVATQVFKAHITATSDSMFYADGSTLVRYGKPFIPSLSRKFYKYMSSTALPFAGIMSASGDSMIITETHASASPNHFIADINTPATAGTRTLTFNSRYFFRPVRARGVVINSDPLTAGQSIKVGYVDSNGDTQYAAAEAVFDGDVATMVGRTTQGFDVLSTPPTRSMDPVVIVEGNPHIRSIDFLYEGSENKPEGNS